LVFYEGVTNKRFVAVSTVTWSRIRGCFSKPRCDFSVTRGGISHSEQYASRKELFNAGD